MSTRTFTFQVTAPPSGTWNPATQAVNTWAEIPNTKLSDQPVMVDSSGRPSGKQDAWCGWCIDARTSDVYSVGQGGHGDYWGNEVNRIRLSDAVPSWSQLVPPSLASAVTGGGYYADGKPCSVHGYYTSIFAPSINRAMRFPGGSDIGGNGVSVVAAFNSTSGQYDTSATWAAVTAAFTVGNGINSYAMHPTTEAVYAWNSDANFFRWNKGVPGSWTQFSPNGSSYPPTTVNYSSAACAADRGTAGQILFLGGQNTVVSHLYDIGANTLTPITWTGTNLSSSPGMGLVYVPASAGAAGGKFYARTYAGAGSNVYVITPNGGTTWACSLLATTGGDLIPSVLDLGTGGCPFTKFLYAPALGGCVFGPRWGANLWFLKLH